MAAMLLLSAKFQGRDWNYNPKSSDGMFCTFLTAKKKKKGFHAAQSDTYAGTHTCTQNSNRIMNVSTNIKDLAISILFQSLWVLYARPCGVILKGPVFITYLSKS